ncbi:MAG TPA: maleylpyruvate isomerase family mycothiol-dependent enzyme [Streptosporangiaceae bacterium]|nr:maleylpyruvate isomerase family mycothiol-dependent enzyme [Streptosporangiaceae bacterium]
MPLTDEDRFHSELRTCTAQLAEIVFADPDHPVPTCPGWTFRKLATHVGRGHRWAAEIVVTRAQQVISVQEVPDGRLPDDPARHAEWLNAGAEQVIAAVDAAGDDPVWTFTGPRPAGFWLRRRAHEAAVHLADAQLAVGQEPDLAAGLAADAVDEWLGILVSNSDIANPAGAWPGARGDGQTLHFHATDDGLDGTGEWLVERTQTGVTVTTGHTRADVAVRGSALGLLLVLCGRLPASDPAVQVLGDQALLAEWLSQTKF